MACEAEINSFMFQKTLIFFAQPFFAKFTKIKQEFFSIKVPQMAKRFCSKLVDEWYWVQTSVALVYLAFRFFRDFLQNSRKYGLETIRKLPSRALLHQAQVNLVDNRN